MDELLSNLEEMLIYSRELTRAKNNGQVSLFESATSNNPNLFSLKKKKDYNISKEEKLFWEKELLGIYISEHPLEQYKAALEKKVTNIKDLDKNKRAGKKTKIIGIINSIKRFITKTGKPMLFVEIEDLTGKIEILVFPKILEKDPEVWEKGKIIILSGKLSNRDDELKILCNKAKELKNYEN